MAAVAHRTAVLSRLRALLSPQRRQQHTSAGDSHRPNPEPAREKQEYHFEGRGKPWMKHAQLQIVNALRLGERENASMMLMNLGKMNHSFGAEDFVVILEYCARSPDPLFVMETWKVMVEKAVDVDKRCCRYISQAFASGGYLKEAINWLTYLGENVCVQGVLPMYNIFLKECGSEESLIDADNCLELMEAQLMGKSEVTYWEILKLAVFQRSLSTVHDVWKDCTRYYSPSIITLRKFIWSFTRLGDLESANRVLQEMVALVNKGSAALMISSSGRYRSPRLDIPIPFARELPDWKLRSNDRKCFLLETEDGSEKSSTDSCGAKQSLCEGNLKAHGVIAPLSHAHEPSYISQLVGSEFPNELEKVNQEECSEFSMDCMEQPGSKSNIPRGITSTPVMVILRCSFNDVILACAISKNGKLAEQLFLQMIDLGLKPSKHTYDRVIKALLYDRGVSFGMKMIELMETQSIKPSNDTFAALSVGQSENLDLDLAENLLGRICSGLPKYIRPFNAFLKACDIMDKPERAVRILAKMRSLNIKPNTRLYELLFSLFGNVNSPYEKGDIHSHADVTKRINIIEMDMRRNGIQHNFMSAKNLIRALGSEGMIDTMLRYLNVAENMLWQSDSYQRSDMYDIVLHALLKEKEIGSAISIFKNMQVGGLPTSVATYNIMIECCSLLKCFRSACALVSLMLRHGFFPQKLTYTALIKVLLANDDFEGALNLVDQSIYEGIEPDIQLFNTVLQEACTKGRIDTIEQIIQYIHEKKIQPDPSTCSYTLDAYTEFGLHSTALEALKVLSLRMISEDDAILQERRAVFEDLIHDEDPDTELRIMDIFNKSEEYTATAILNLRLCAIAGLSISWLPEESPWSKRLSSCYGSREGAT